MRNPMNSWAKSDSYFDENGKYIIGESDMKLALTLARSGSDDRKFLRQIFVSVDVTAPLYWWKEYDTYKVGTVANSCSTMHKIHAKEFTIDDFSHDRMTADGVETLMAVIDHLNQFRQYYLETKDKDYWYDMIQSLPSSYNQKRTVLLNYEVLRNIYHARRNHKLDEWHVFCERIEDLPHAQLITG
jgi:hypothetical protein